LLQFYGANRTGRFAGRLIQIQNLPQNKIPDLSLARELLRSGDHTSFEMLFGNVPMILSQLIRTAFIPKDGHRFYVADFSAIEARMIAWFSGEEWRMNVFRSHGKIYEASAAAAFHVPIETIAKGQVNYALRQRGKVLELACGYGGSVGAVDAMDYSGAIPVDERKGMVDAWRAASPNIVKFWWDVDSAAISAVKNPGQTFKTHKLEFKVTSGILFIKLPSGRSLAYVRPRMENGKFGKPVITYEGMNQVTKKWTRIDTYGPKLVENCLAGDTEVMTDKGWVRIDKITRSMKVYDGLEFVNHEGLVHKGKNITINLDGVRMTPDHRVLTQKGWFCASQSNGFNRKSIRKPNGYRLRRSGWEKVEMVSRMCVLRKTENNDSSTFKNEPILWVSEKQTNRRKIKNSWNVTPSSIRSVALNARPMSIKDASSLSKLRSEGNICLRGMVNFRGVLERYGANLRKWIDSGEIRQQQGLLKAKLFLGGSLFSSKQQKDKHQDRRYVTSSDSRQTWCEKVNYILQIPRRGKRLRPNLSSRRTESVYDLANAGLRHRFVVRGESGPLIVHNCVQAASRDCLADSMVRLDKLGYKIVMHVHDEVIIEAPDTDPDNVLNDICDVMGLPPKWAPDLPLRADGYHCDFYKKD
jgi:hypothetical protein